VGVRIAFVGVVQSPTAACAASARAPTIGMAIAFFTQIGDFAFLEIERLELAHLERSISLRESRSRALPSSSTVRLTSAIQVLCASRTLPVSSRFSPNSSSNARCELARGQRLEFVLAVDIHTEPADIAQQLQRNRDAVEVVATGTARRSRSRARTSELVRRKLRPTARPGFSPQSRRALADCRRWRESSARSAPALTTRRRPCRRRSSASASTTMDLPAPVSPVSTVRPGAQLELERIDDGEVTDLQMGQHGSLGLADSAASPMELGTQQAVILELVRMQQCDLLRSRMNFQSIARGSIHPATRRRR